VVEVIALFVPPFHVHLDVIVLAAFLEAAYLWALARLRPASLPPGEPSASRRQVAWYTCGVATLAVATAWPMHDLAEGYLLSVHMVQHLLISLVVPPMLLLGLPPWLLRWLLSPAPLRWVVGHLARPFVAFVLFNFVIVVTHWPVLVDLMLRHHALHFVGHAALFGSAALMWWPVIDPLPEMPGLSHPGRMLYLFLQSIVPTVPASFLTFGSAPMYQFYAQVPRIWGLSALTDQTIAGLIMKLVGGFILWAVIAVTFFRWFREEQATGWDALKFRDVEREIRTELTRR
jgi:putative membrane protein